MNSKINKSVLGATLLIVFGIVSRFLLVNQPNVSGLEALALFGGAYFMIKRFAFIIPLAAYMLSDFIINNTIYSSYYNEGLVFFQPYMLWTISSLILIVLFGKILLKKVSFKSSALGIIGATTIFWVVSNLGSWVGSGLYTLDFAGLLTCFLAAIPFYGYSLLGNAAFGLILFGGYEWIKSQNPALAMETSKA